MISVFTIIKLHTKLKRLIKNVFKTQPNIKRELFPKIVNSWKLLTIYAKSFILDVWPSFEQGIWWIGQLLFQYFFWYDGQRFSGEESSSSFCF